MENGVTLGALASTNSRRLTKNILFRRTKEGRKKTGVTLGSRKTISPRLITEGGGDRKRKKKKKKKKKTQPTKNLPPAP